MSVSSNAANMESVEPKVPNSLNSETHNVNSIPQEDTAVKSTCVTEVISSDKRHVVENNINDNFDLEAATNNPSVEKVLNDNIDVKQNVEKPATPKDESLETVTSKMQKCSVIKQKVSCQADGDPKDAQNNLETDASAGTSTENASDTKQTSENNAGKVVLQSKSSASLSNLLVYNSNDSSSDDSSCDENTNKETFNSKNVYRIESSSSSSVSSGEFMYDSDGDYSSSEELR